MREHRAVGLEHREVKPRRRCTRRELVQQAGQSEGRHHIAGQAFADALGNAQVDHLDPAAIGVRHEETARIGGLAAALGRAAGEFGLELRFGARDTHEQGRTGRRVEHPRDGEVRVAAFDARKFRALDQQPLGALAPQLRWFVGAGQVQHASQVGAQHLAQLLGAGEHAGLHFLLRLARAVVQCQPEKQSLHRHQQHHQRNPEKPARPILAHRRDRG